MTPIEKFAKEYLEKNPKMTALEIFAKEMIHLGFPIPQGRYEKCMEMQKQQLETAYINGCNESSHCADWAKQAEEYYKQTFKK